MITPLEREIFNETNRQRAIFRVQHLNLTEAGCDDARKHSMVMASEGRLFHNFSSDEHTKGAFSENVLSMPPNSDAIHAVEAWMNSTKGHRENLISGAHESCGIGIHPSSTDGTLYVTQRFYSGIQQKIGLIRLPHLIKKDDADDAEETESRWNLIEI